VSGSVKGFLIAIALAAFAVLLSVLPAEASGAVVAGAALSLLAASVIRRADDSRYLLLIFFGGLAARVAVGTGIYALGLHEFFGGDATLYDEAGYSLLRVWQGEEHLRGFVDSAAAGWGMLYIVAGTYAVTGRSMLAIQYVNAVVGAATAPVVYLCARQMFRSVRVARLSAALVAFFPSLVLWSSQGLKDGPIIFLLALAMLATLRLGERLSVGNMAILLITLLGVLSLRFYVFYMLAAAVGGALIIGMRSVSGRNLARQVVAVGCVGLGLTYFGVLRTASTQIGRFANLEAIQRSRQDLATSAESGFGRDVDVSTTSGALTVIPIGITYILFAPFPWEMANLRQSITLPEMIVWWSSFPLLVLGLYFTVKHRLRQALPVLMFISMLTLAYSLFQGNVGTAYRQRAQIMIFYFIFVAVGYVLLKERQEDRARRGEATRRELTEAARAIRDGRRARELGRQAREREWAQVARGIDERLDT
jgi:hypothetical protein